MNARHMRFTGSGRLLVLCQRTHGLCLLRSIYWSGQIFINKKHPDHHESSDSFCQEKDVVRFSLSDSTVSNRLHTYENGCRRVQRSKLTPSQD